MNNWPHDNQLADIAEKCLQHTGEPMNCGVSPNDLFYAVRGLAEHILFLSAKNQALKELCAHYVPKDKVLPKFVSDILDE